MLWYPSLQVHRSFVHVCPYVVDVLMCGTHFECSNHFWNIYSWFCKMPCCTIRESRIVGVFHVYARSIFCTSVPIHFAMSFSTYWKTRASTDLCKLADNTISASNRIESLWFLCSFCFFEALYVCGVFLLVYILRSLIPAAFRMPWLRKHWCLARRVLLLSSLRTWNRKGFAAV